MQYQLQPTHIFLLIAVAIIIVIKTSLRFLKGHERAAIFRFGRFAGIRGPGPILMIPLWIEQMQRVNLLVVTNNVSVSEVITKDNITISLNAVLTFRVTEPDKVVVVLGDLDFAIGQIAQSSIRSVVKHLDLDELVSDRDNLDQKLKNELDKHCDSLGIEVIALKFKDFDIPDEYIVKQQFDTSRQLASLQEQQNKTQDKT